MALNNQGKGAGGLWHIKKKKVNSNKKSMVGVHKIVINYP